VPHLFGILCPTCTEESWVSVATTWIEMDDGSEQIVGHPGEVRRVEEWTGRSFHEVLDADRLHYDRLLVCRACKATGQYRDDRCPRLRRAAEHKSADELDEDQKQRQTELWTRDPALAEKLAAAKAGAFAVQANP
jgi:hypothetical protein